MTRSIIVRDISESILCEGVAVPQVYAAVRLDDEPTVTQVYEAGWGRTTGGPIFSL